MASMPICLSSNLYPATQQPKLPQLTNIGYCLQSRLKLYSKVLLAYYINIITHHTVQEIKKLLGDIFA